MTSTMPADVKCRFVAPNRKIFVVGKMLGNGMMQWRLNGAGNRGRPVGGSERPCYHDGKHEQMRIEAVGGLKW